MKNLLIPLLLLFSLNLSAQDQESLDKIESAKIGLITERLQLTPEQAEKFWPLYREYNNKRMELRRELRSARDEVDPQRATEEERKQLIEMGLRIKERELALEQDYSKRMLEVIDSRQLLSLRRAEEDFKRMLIERIERRREQQMRREKYREQMEDRTQRRRNN